MIETSLSVCHSRKIRKLWFQMDQQVFRNSIPNFLVTCRGAPVFPLGKFHTIYDFSRFSVSYAGKACNTVKEKRNSLWNRVITQPWIPIGLFL